MGAWEPPVLPAESTWRERERGTLTVRTLLYLADSALWPPQTSPDFVTELHKKTGPRLRERAVSGSWEARSRNLGPTL